MSESPNQSLPIAAENIKPDKLSKTADSVHAAVATKCLHKRLIINEFAESAAGVQLLFDRFAKDEAAHELSLKIGLSSSLIEIIWSLADLAALNDVSAA
ncbi:MAG: hypothetical protein VX561_10745 [Pseudomonadota bacterium]|nr:hypothetical protein [Pseudomonadota bacterium]